MHNGQVAGGHYCKRKQKCEQEIASDEEAHLWAMVLIDALHVDVRVMTEKTAVSGVQWDEGVGSTQNPGEQNQRSAVALDPFTRKRKRVQRDQVS